MIYADEIMKARIYMAKQCGGDHECVSCGLSDRAEKLISKTVKSTFCSFDELMIGKGKYICEGCASLMEDKDMRFKAVLFRAPGEKETPAREEILKIIKDPPNEFVMSLPYSYKKHHWLYAGMSNREIALIGTDNRTIPIDYRRFDVPCIIDTIRILINTKIPRHEIISGKYSTYSRYKMPDIDKYDDIISGMRACGAVEMIVKYTPPAEKGKEIKGEKIMITVDEKNAAMLLLEIAINSEVRKSDGIRFWSGYFERRINRLKNLEMHEFASKLASAVGCSKIGTAIIDAITDEEKVMDEIRKKTNLIISIAYTIYKEGARNGN